MIHPKIFFEILHTIAPLCLEKSDGVQFLKKNSYCYKMGHFCPNLDPKNLIALFMEFTLTIFVNFV